MKPDLILWDYDGTLVNSVPKNIAITKQILSAIVPRLSGENLPKHLLSEEAYHVANHKAKNWQDLYMNYYGMDEAETQLTGSLWSQYQLSNTTPVLLFPEIKEVIQKLKVPQGICSQNSAQNIRKLLLENGVLENFNAIVGYDDIPGKMQKPMAYGGMKCIGQIFENPLNKTIFYIGDHEADVEFARNIASELHSSNRVIAIAATYSGADPKSWSSKPDFELSSPAQLFNIVA